VVRMKKLCYIRKYWFVLTVLLLGSGVFSPIANGDIGPKPSLDIIVNGIDTSEYWLDLLVTDSADHSWFEITEEESAKVSKLADYKDDEGFHPALLVGTGVPLFGQLRGEKQSDGSFLHRFGYLGVPKEFKIAILKEDGTLIISDIVIRKQFQSVMEYDVENLKVTEEIVTSAGKVTEKMPWADVLKGFIPRLILTLLVEILIAFSFGFRSKKSFQILFITNTVTQVILNIIIFSMYGMGGPFIAMVIFILAEVFVIIAELIVYLQSLTEKSKTIRFIYTVLANLASLAVGVMLFFVS